MTTQALVLADEQATHEWLGEALAGRVSVLPADRTDAEGFAAEIAQTPGIGLVFVELDERNADERMDVLRRVAQQHPELGLAAVSQRENSDSVLAAMRAGADDFLVVGGDHTNLDALVDKVEARTASRPAGRGGNGKVISVVSGAPVVGVSFLAVHLALGLQQRGGAQRRVLLADLTVPGGASLVFLDIEQQYSALDALRDVDRCDQTLIETAFTRYRDEGYVLSMPEETVAPYRDAGHAAGSHRDTAAPPVEAQEVERLLANFSLYFDYVVVAANSGIGLRPLGAAVAAAEQSLLVTDQTVVTGRQNKHLLHALRQADTPMDALSLVIDRYQSDMGLTPQRLAQLLDLPHTASLGGAERARLEAMDAGEPMFEYAPRDQYCRDVDALIQALTGEQAPATKPGGLFRRWLG